MIELANKDRRIVVTELPLYALPRGRVDQGLIDRETVHTPNVLAPIL
jgi:hypothetical protein